MGRQENNWCTSPAPYGYSGRDAVEHALQGDVHEDDIRVQFPCSADDILGGIRDPHHIVAKRNKFAFQRGSGDRLVLGDQNACRFHISNLVPQEHFSRQAQGKTPPPREFLLQG